MSGVMRSIDEDKVIIDVTLNGVTKSGTARMKFHMVSPCEFSDDVMYCKEFIKTINDCFGDYDGTPWMFGSSTNGFILDDSCEDGIREATDEEVDDFQASVAEFEDEGFEEDWH